MRKGVLLAVALAILAVAGIAITAAGAAGGVAGSATSDAHGEESAFVVDVDADGDATATLWLSYDLEDGDERDAFEELRGDDAARDDFRDRFADRLADAAAAADVDRETSISDANIDLSATDDVGTVELSVRWSGLAAVDGDAVTVAEPFASGFAPDQRFVLVGPDGSEPVDATPEPDDVSGVTLSWDGGTELEGLTATFADAESADGTDADADDGGTDDIAPGFGSVVVIVSLVIVTFLATRRR